MEHDDETSRYDDNDSPRSRGQYFIVSNNTSDQRSEISNFDNHYTVKSDNYFSYETYYQIHQSAYFFFLSGFFYMKILRDFFFFF